MSEKTFKPTRRKLLEARKRGEVVRSRDVGSFGTFVGLWIFLGFGAAYLIRHLNHIIERAMLAADPSEGDAGSVWLPQVQSMVLDLIWILAPILCLGVGCAVLTGVLQTRGVLSITPITPKFERLNPAHGLRNLFSTRQLFELGKMLLKSAALSAMLAYCAAMSLDPLMKLVHAPALELLPISGSLLWRLMGWAAVIYACGAVLDYAHQFYEFMKRQKMSIEELRRELRDREGDPLIKRRRRAIAREAVFGARISSASVVVTNPTHVAVALQYMPGKTPLPRVIVKGLDDVALNIRVRAAQHGVPILEDPPLARKLFREVALDHYINEELIDVVAAAFRWARQVDRRAPRSISPTSIQSPTPRTV
jgi:type III secretion protein U